MYIVPRASSGLSTADARQDIEPAVSQTQAQNAFAHRITPIEIDFGGPVLAMFSCTCGCVWRIYRRRDGSWAAIERCSGCRAYCPELVR